MERRHGVSLSALASAAACLALLTNSAEAQVSHDVFSDDANGAKLHGASGFVCPLRLGPFERDAVGERDPQAHADFCAYSALDGVYGTIMLMPLPKTYDPKAILEPDFIVQEGTGGQMLGETVLPYGPKAAPLSVYVRTYETAKLESVHYRTLFASAAVGNWSVQVVLEYVDPRDNEIKTGFLQNAYSAAVAEIAVARPAP